MRLGHYIITAAVLLAAQAHAGNYATCLLERLPGIKNGPAHVAAFALCRKKYPEEFYEIRQGEGRGLFSYDSGADCTFEKAKDTSFAPAAGMIHRACECLYTEALSKGQMCAVRDWEQGVITFPSDK